MLERKDLYDPELVGALVSRRMGQTASPHPQRGVHRSRFKGASLEFAEHTEYSPGDDLKRLDWKIFAKTDRYYVRRYEDERLARALIAVDASNSMTYGGTEGGLIGSKFHLAAVAAVAAATALVKQGDAVGLMVTGLDPIYLEPRPGQAQVEAVLEVLRNTRPGKDAPVGEAVSEAVLKLGRSASLMVVSDLLHEEDEDLGFLAGLASRRIFSGILQVLSPDETDLPFEGGLKFIDLETAGELMLDPDGVRAAYAGEMAAFIRGVRKRAGDLGAPWALVRERGELPSALGAVLTRLDPAAKKVRVRWTG